MPTKAYKRYEEALEVFKMIERQRALTENEQARLDYIIKRIKNIPREVKHMQDNREKRIQSRINYAKTAKGRKVQQQANKRCYEKFKLDRRRRAKEWRLNNPEKYEALKERQRLKRQVDKQALG
jgi:hypothetical protein